MWYWMSSRVESSGTHRRDVHAHGIGDHVCDGARHRRFGRLTVGLCAEGAGPDVRGQQHRSERGVSMEVGSL